MLGPMIQNNRLRIFLIIMVILTLVNLAAVITVMVNVKRAGLRQATLYQTEQGVLPGEPGFRGTGFLMDELGFDSLQREAFINSRQNFRIKAHPLFTRIRQLNNEALHEILQATPDTNRLALINSRIGGLHAQVKNLTVKHLLEVKSIATPDQQEKLKFFYRELLSRDSGPKGNGKGPQHRHRGGRN